jgi:type IX secretion system PorP/SprF family membrane protein
MNQRKIYLTLLILMGTGIFVSAQQSPLFSQYMVNKFIYNPAIAGGNGYTDINMVAREQYVGLENAPRTFALTAQSRLLDESYIMRKLRIRKNINQASIFTNVGLGGSIFSDRNGLVSNTGLQFSYAYHINFNNRYQLSMGLSLAAFQYKLDDSDAFIVDTDDPVLMGNKKQFWVPDATFGVYFTDNRSFVGLTVTDLLGSGIRLGEDPIKENFSTIRNFNIMAGSSFDLNENFNVKPSAMARINTFQTILDLNARFFYQDAYWLGVSYRTDNSIIAMLGIYVDMFRIAYAYDATLGNMGSYHSGSHEIIFGVRLGDNSARRFRWLREDKMEFDM